MKRLDGRDFLFILALGLLILGLVFNAGIAVFLPNAPGTEYGNMEKLQKQVQARVTYRSDSGRDTWSLPAETLGRGYGDCEDRALVLMQALFLETGFKAPLVLVYYEALQTDPRVVEYSAEVLYRDQRWLTPEGLSEAQLRSGWIEQTLSYDEAFAIARGQQSLRYLRGGRR